MNNDLISREALINAKPEFMNEKIVRDTKYQTSKERIYAKAWNACNSYWLNTIKNALTVENNEYNRGFMHAMIMVGKEAEERPQGEWIYGNLDYSTCSNCNYANHYGDFPFCPNCGADMRMEKNDK